MYPVGFLARTHFSSMLAPFIALTTGAMPKGKYGISVMALYSFFFFLQGFTQPCRRTR